MNMRYPGTQLVARELWEDELLKPLRKTHRVWALDWDRECLYIAPRWIAWLYRWLPYHFSWQNTPEQRCAQAAPYYLWHIMAMRWHLGLVPASRQPEYQARWGVLRWGTTGMLVV